MSTANLPLVMLIDDNDIDLFLNKKFLRVAGITDNTISFASAREALDYIIQHVGNQEKMPEYILLDIQMPEINGFQFLEMLANTPEVQGMTSKIIMLSSTTDPIDLTRAHDDAKVVNILCKPLNPNALKDLIAKCA